MTDISPTSPAANSGKPQRKAAKAPRPKAEPPKGFRDYFGPEVTERLAMLERIAEVYRSHGFEALESAAVETVEALGKFLPDVDRPNEGVFAWRDEDESWLALRYDLTAPLARVYAQHRNDLPNPYRRYAFGPVWRNEKPGPGRFRQFYQCDADTVGSASMAADAEMAALLAGALEAAGVSRAGYVISLNNRKLLNGAMQAAGLFDPDAPDAHSAARGIVLRAIDKIDRLGSEGVADLLGAGRRDGSGDFTEGAKLSPDQAAIVMGFVTARGTDNADTLARLADVVGATELGRQGIEELDEIGTLAMAMGLDEARITIDPGVVRGLGYYTGPVIEAALTHEIRDEKGRIRQFGSVAGGGRYDDLVRRFTGQTVPATGVSLGVDRLLAAMKALGSDAAKHPGPVVITVMDRAAMAGYQVMAHELRAGGIMAEVYLGNPKNFGNQLKYADRRASPVAVIEGEDERARGVVQIKDLVQGAAIAEGATVEEWKARPSQIEVPRTDLVAEVRAMLGRHS